MTRRSLLFSTVAALLFAAAVSAQSITVSFPVSRSEKPLDGRLLLLLSNDPSEEPRMQIDDTPKSKWFSESPSIAGNQVNRSQSGRMHRVIRAQL